MSKTDISRREFTAASVMALLAGVTITISGCGGGSNPGGPDPVPAPTPTPTPAPSGDKSGVVSANHGHVATVTAAQITAAGAVSIDIHGMADHTHSLELTATEVQQIGAGTKVSKVSSSNLSHDHTVTFN
jgi:hypothetical protein